VARGRHCADKEPHADRCQTFEHFWHYSFTSDATAKLYRLEVGQLEVRNSNFRCYNPQSQCSDHSEGLR
jgi:hypothetical protein